MRTPNARIAAACLLVLAISPPDAVAQLVQSSSGFAFARVFENQAGVTLMPGPGSLGVTLGATAADLVDLADEQYLVDFNYEASVLGVGSVTWGSANGILSLDTSSVPELPVALAALALAGLRFAQRMDAPPSENRVTKVQL